MIDPRSLVPFDWETVKASVAKTGRVVIVEESPKRNGAGRGDCRHVGRGDDRVPNGADPPGGGAQHARPVRAADGEILRSQRGSHRRRSARADGVLNRESEQLLRVAVHASALASASFFCRATRR